MSSGAASVGLQPTSVTKDREPNRWGAGGPGPPAHGQVVSSAAAKADAGAYALGELKLDHTCKSECDEGDMDSYQTHTLTYKGETVWTFSTSSHSNIGGSWGTSSTCSIRNADTLAVELTHNGRTVGGGHDSNETREYSLRDLLSLAAR